MAVSVLPPGGQRVIEPGIERYLLRSHVKHELQIVGLVSRHVGSPLGYAVAGSVFALRRSTDGAICLVADLGDGQSDPDSASLIHL